MEENDLATKSYQINDMAWLKSKDKPLGRSASLGIWLDTAEAVEWVIHNGPVFGQRYIGSIELYQIKKKRCHRCSNFRVLLVRTPLLRGPIVSAWPLHDFSIP